MLSILIKQKHINTIKSEVFGVAELLPSRQVSGKYVNNLLLVRFVDGGGKPVSGFCSSEGLFHGGELLHFGCYSGIFLHHLFYMKLVSIFFIVLILFLIFIFAVYLR